MRYVGIGVTFIAIVVGVSLILAFPTMWCVNYLIAPSVLTALFGVSKLTLFKAWCLDFVIGLFRSTTIAASK